MLDINLFRVEKGNDPEKIRESQRRRFASVEIVDEIVALDKEWRQRKDLWLRTGFVCNSCSLISCGLWDLLADFRSV